MAAYQAIFGFYTGIFELKSCLCQYVHTFHICTGWSSEVSANDNYLNLESNLFLSSQKH